MWIIWPIVAALVTGAVALAARKESERVKKEEALRDKKLVLDAKDQDLRAKELELRERELRPEWEGRGAGDSSPPGPGEGTKP